jgi:predicted lipoprotein with Yx(FWY)xxD motif/plastocyanin
MYRGFYRSLKSSVAYPRFRMAGFAVIVLALVMTACAAPSAAPAPAQPAPAQPTAQATPQLLPNAGTGGTPSATGPAMVMLGQNDKLGQFLVDSKGMSLYLYTKDSKNTSSCYDKCATAWPPLLTNGAPTGANGLDASLLGTTTRTDGKMQVTYNGWPLYYWFKDQKPGDTSGQLVGGVWFVVSAKGDKIDTSGTTPAAQTPAPTAAASGPAASGQAAGQTVQVDLKNFAFTPKTLTVAPGTTVVWMNSDSAAHTVTADDGSFDSGNLNQGATFKFTFSKAGTFAFYCMYHGGKGGVGMAGQIIVK